MTVKTEYGWLVYNEKSRIRVVECDGFLLVGDWASSDPACGASCFREALRTFGGEKCMVKLDAPDERLERFYRKAGFQTLAMVRNWPGTGKGK